MIYINEIVDAISFRFNRDDMEFKNLIRFHVINVSSTLKKQHIDKYGFDDSLVETTTFKLERDILDCDKKGCYRMVSVNKIPDTIRNNMNLPFLSVGDIYGNVFSYTTLQEYQFKQYETFTSNYKYYFLHNDRLVIINNQFIKEVVIRAVFEEPQFKREYLKLHRDNIPALIDMVSQLVTPIGELVDKEEVKI